MHLTIHTTSFQPTSYENIITKKTAESVQGITEINKNRFFLLIPCLVVCFYVIFIYFYKKHKLISRATSLYWDEGINLQETDTISKCNQNYMNGKIPLAVSEKLCLFLFFVFGWTDISCQSN